MKHRSHVPLRHSIAAFAAIASTGLFSQTTSQSTSGALPVVLPAVVVTATRTPRNPADIPSSVVQFTPVDWELTQTPGLADLLRSLPGVAVVSTGATGSQTALFLRGSAPHQTLFLVDGVRMNDRGAFYQNFLGGADLANVALVEVLRGPQSVLYGGSAMGGVISTETLKGDGPASLRANAEGGSFSTAAGGAAVSGSDGGFAYSASANWFETANERPGNDFEQGSWSTRFDWSCPGVSGLSVGLTLRGMDSTFEEPGSRGPFPFTGVLDLNQNLATAFAKFDGGAFRSRLILAAQDREYSFTSMYGSTPVESRRRVIDFQATVDVSDTLEVTGGIDYEPSRQETPADTKNEKLFAAFVSGVWKPSEHTSAILGVRHDHFDSIGGHATWRAGIAHTVAGTGTTLRAAAGTAFTAPSLDDRYGNVAFFQPPTPGIRPEESRGWEVGIEQSLEGGRGRVMATWFSNRYRDLFGFDPNTFATINIGRAQSEGIEIAGEFKPRDGLQVLAGYTWMNAEDSSTGAQLVRRPEHAANVDVQFEPSENVLLGAGFRWVANRVDVGSLALPDYATVRVHAAWQATPRLRAHVRVENLLDREYEEVAGYPALGVGAFGGITVTF